MKPLKRILIATDFSKYANNALKRALKISMKHHASLTGMHVIWDDWLGRLLSLSSSQSRGNLYQLKARLKKQFTDEIKKESSRSTIKSDFVVKTGREYVEITKAAKSGKFGLIVLGAHGERYLDELILGSTAENVIKNSNEPVLLVRNKPSFGYKRILVTIDFSPVSRVAIESAYRLFPDAEFELLYVADLWYANNTRQYQPKHQRERVLRKDMRLALTDKMNDFLSECNVGKAKVKVTLKGGYPATAINECATKNKSDLVVIGTRGQSQFEYILLGSVTKKILQLVKKDILVVPPIAE